MDKFKKIKLYDIKYLQNNELSEDDLHNVFDTKSLSYSLKIYMIKLICPTINEQTLIHTLTDNTYYKTYTFTNKLFEQAINDIAIVYKNIYRYNTKRCYQTAEGYVMFNGLKVKNNNFFEI